VDRTLVATVEDHRIALLAALAITIHIAESALPTPLPGIKPGLANIITIATLCLYGLRTAAWVLMLRVLAGSLLLGTLAAMAHMAGQFTVAYWLFPSTSITAFDRLALTVFLAIALHMIFILGVSFDLELLRTPEESPLPTMEITLVHSRSEEAPEQADYLAQVNQRGGGNSPEKVRPSSQNFNPLPIPKQGDAPLTQQAASPRPQQDPLPAMQMITAEHAERAIPELEEKRDKPSRPEPVTAARLMESSQELASLEHRQSQLSGRGQEAAAVWAAAAGCGDQCRRQRAAYRSAALFRPQDPGRRRHSHRYPGGTVCPLPGAHPQGFRRPAHHPHLGIRKYQPATDTLKPMEQTNLTNQFLIAMPALADPNFVHSVTYICEHNEDGALGIVVNRKTDVHLADLFRSMDLEDTDPEIAAQPVFSGGPVHPEQGFVLHQPAGDWASTLRVSDEISITTSHDIIEAIAHGKGPERYFVALGYAGWGGGQLEEELAANAWLSGPVDSRIIFETPVEQRWEAAATLLGVDLSLLSNDIGHA